MEELFAFQSLGLL
jgi:hypothetical protein